MLPPAVTLVAAKREGCYHFLLRDSGGFERKVASSQLEGKDVAPVLRAMSSLLSLPPPLMTGTLTEKRAALRQLLNGHGSSLKDRACPLLALPQLVRR
jgi:hypothetical protein